MALINKIPSVAKDRMNNDFNFNRIKRPVGNNPYYFIVHDGVNLYIKTTDPVVGVTDTVYDIVAADTLEELEQIIIDLNLIDRTVE